jgi:hypothetical protein
MFHNINLQGLTLFSQIMIVSPQDPRLGTNPFVLVTSCASFMVVRQIKNYATDIMICHQIQGSQTATAVTAEFTGSVHYLQ